MERERKVFHRRRFFVVVVVGFSGAKKKMKEVQAELS